MEANLRERTAANRRRIADVYDGTASECLSQASLCAGWDLRTLLGHVVMPLVTSPTRLALAALRHRSVHRASSAIATELGRRPVAALTALLRDRAEQQVPAPGVGPMGQFVDCCVHLRDAARPLGADADAPLDDWALVLAWLPSRAAGLGHVPRGLLHGLSWRATDLPWSYGAGPVVEARAEPLSLAMTDRAAVLPELTGPGVPELARRLRTD